VVGEGPLGFRALALGNFQFVAQAHGRDTEQFVVGFDAAFDVGLQTIICGNSARFQRAGECSRQSTS
jgi:hypothetical protein